MNFDQLWPYDLRKGSSRDPRAGACTMDAVSWFAYGHLGDRPECASPALTRYVIVGQDAMPHDVRQRLKPFIFRLIGSRDPDVESARVRILVLAAVRRFAPMALEALECRSEAEILRAMPDDTSFRDLERAMSTLSPGSARLAALSAQSLGATAAAEAAAAGAAGAAVGAEYAGAVKVWDEYFAVLDAALNAGKQGDFDLDMVPARIQEFEAARC